MWRPLPTCIEKRIESLFLLSEFVTFERAAFFSFEDGSCPPTGENESVETAHGRNEANGISNVLFFFMTCFFEIVFSTQLFLKTLQ